MDILKMIAIAFIIAIIIATATMVTFMSIFGLIPNSYHEKEENE